MARKENHLNSGASHGKKELNSSDLEDLVDDLEESECSNELRYNALDTPTTMELQNPSIYKVHEQIHLDYPSLTICKGLREGLFLVENAAEENNPKIKCLEIELNASANNSIKEIAAHRVPSQINRIRTTSNNILSVSDSTFIVHSPNLSYQTVRPIKGGYALCSYDNLAFYGNGEYIVRDAHLDGNSVDSIQSDHAEIYSVCALDSNTVAISTQTLSLCDFRDGSRRQIHQSKCDVNSIAYNRDNMLAIGDDNGLISLIDVRTGNVLENIPFHQSSITQIEFSSRECFASSASCEVALWDCSFTEEWEYHKYLHFVHQGHPYYKDLAYIDERTLITTSYSGLCIFSPANENPDE
ncbi:hypothetical protein NEOKW01_1749 [Nematocida sp. AWRm80]|nr:hypothetical protein NEOKW01_1749 [Nematocida sp. AWRm80]